MKCPHCLSETTIKKGFMVTKKNTRKIRRHQCKCCKRTFTNNSQKDTFLQKRPDLNKKIMVLYCEGNTLKGIARILGTTYKTVVRKFKFMAHKARELHLKNIDEKNLITKYVQFDEMETFEIDRTRPLGIELAVRPKTFQIVAIKVCRIPIRALAISPKLKAQYAARTNRKQGMTEMLLEVSKCLTDGSTLVCDDASINIKVSKEICSDSDLKTYHNEYNKMWALNHICAKLRHHLSRLRRKTWATTKKLERLQMHLDLFIAYQNGYEI